MDNVEEALTEEILEGLHQFVGNNFSFKHNDVDNILEVVEYTEEGEVFRRLKVTVNVLVETVG